MTPEQQAALDKIKKLLRMKRGGTPAKPVENPEPGLVLINAALARRDSYITKHFGQLKESGVEPDGDAEDAKHAGYRAGLATEIRSGLGSSNACGQALLT